MTLHWIAVELVCIAAVGYLFWIWDRNRHDDES